MKSGILVLYKEKNMTSHDAVNIVRKLFGTKKVGHTGTLDPEATGVLPILVGSAVKISEYVTGGRKEYRARVRFGIFTDTEDIWGNVVSESDKRCTEKEFSDALYSFVGKYMQIPPMMSAVKIGGRKLYEIFRAGETAVRTPRECEIFSVKLISFSGDEAEISVECSKGTYIRTFIFDVCEKIGIKGTMSSLVREKSSVFKAEDSVRLSELEKMTLSEREEKLIPTEMYFSDTKKVLPPPFYARLIKNGCTVDIKKFGFEANVGEIVRIYGESGFYALGKIVENNNNPALKKIKEIN